MPAFPRRTRRNKRVGMLSLAGNGEVAEAAYSWSSARNGLYTVRVVLDPKDRRDGKEFLEKWTVWTELEGRFARRKGVE